MGRRSKTAGITTDRYGNKVVDKIVLGQRIKRRLGPVSQEEAERFLAQEIERLRKAKLFGTRPGRTFREAAVKYLRETSKATKDLDALHLKQLDPFIGSLVMHQVHDGTLEGFKAERRRKGISDTSIKRALEVVRHILNLAARSWRDEFGVTWLETPPLISMPTLEEARRPYPLSWDEQSLLFSELPAHLARMALYKVNTGCREQEVCKLQWAWEQRVPELDTSVFVIPSDFGGRDGRGGVKNREDRLVVLNPVARRVVEEMRAQHPVYVFTYAGIRKKRKPLYRMNNTGWDEGVERATARYREVLGTDAPEGFKRLRVHDLKHTFGRRLRAAGVPLETRKVLLGHTTTDITSHYSAAEIAELLEAVNRLDDTRETPAITLLKVVGRRKWE